uniref:Rho-GAP domain-containing protein n=1 Tax=Heterorhabditis bacteriophora TaxID=37862 RepID=A0A1I7WJ29_HETBA
MDGITMNGIFRMALSNDSSSLDGTRSSAQLESKLIENPTIPHQINYGKRNIYDDSIIYIYIYIYICIVAQPTFLGFCYIDVREIKNYCNDLGIPLDDQRAQNIVEKFVVLF